jgi:diguanylate cyclase (GGDEF)-like protein
MTVDIRTLLIALMINLITIALALPAVMGRVNAPARRAQWSAVLQAAGWVLILLSGVVERGSRADWLLSSASMASMAVSLALLGAAFDLWCGRRTQDRWLGVLAVLMPLGYALGFSNYAFRVGWANGLLALQMVMVAAALGRTTVLPVGRWRWLVVISLLAQAVVTLWRGALGAFFTDAYPRFLTPHPVNYASAIVALATSMLTLVGILLAHRDDSARELERLATVDGLTGVFNRRAWLDLARARFAASLRYGHSMAVLMIDIDHFKQINDAHGHDAGDRALGLVARELQAAARAGDIVCRYGGEEFCVLMVQADDEAARRFDKHLRQRLDEAAIGELGFEIGYSAGVSRCHDDADTLDAMLKRADAALYRAKDGGRSRTLDTSFGQLQAA